MLRKLTSLTIASIAACAALVPAAGAADAPAPKLELKGAYLYVDHIAKQDFVRVVFRTASPLPRRFDGLIRASASIEGVGHSLGTVKKGTTCYTALSEVKGGSIATLDADGKVVRKGAKIGRTFTVKVITKDGQSVTRKLPLRAERKGDATGKPLGC
jgi:hypothetical protein